MPERSQQSPVTLRVDGLRKTYGDGSTAVTAVDDVSFAIEPGRTVGLLGPNGAGKTTTIKSILGLVRPDAGEVRIGDVDATADPRSAYRHVSAVLEGARNVYWRLTVAENLRFFAGLQGRDLETADRRRETLLEQFDLVGKRDEPVRNLSRGMKQKVAIACAFMRDTPVVFLDEPTLGLDVEATARFADELRRLAADERRTLVLSSHDMDVVESVCDRVIIMNDGSVVADDAVERLVDVFRTRSYRFVVEGSREDLRAALAEFDTSAHESREDGLAFEVTFEDRDRLYDLMDALRGAGGTVDEVESLEPDLAEIFLDVTGGDPRGTPATTTHGNEPASQP